MREYVYLFELDSVRKTDEEIIAGQKALYSEIFNNGNIVVLTYNQLVDSRGFFSLLKDSEYQKYFIRLFENGAIRISQYGDIRSLSQYLINSVESEKQFIYSALPVKSSQRRLLSLIKRSLLYSDLSEIFEYSTGTNRSEKELIELFEELVDDETKSPENSEGTQKKKKILKQSSLFDEEAVNHSKESVVQEMRNILQKLYWLALLPCIKWIHIPAGLKSVADQALEWLLLLIVSEVVTSGLAHVCPVLSSLSDALGDIGNLIKDAIDISFAKPAIYNNNCMADIAAGEKRNKSVPISLVLSPELKKYIKYQKNGTHADLFKNSSIYPIADVNDESITKNLMQLEELYGYKFGVVYQSNFNTLIVDPIKSSNSEAPKKFFPYERIVSPNGKNGVVMIPKYKNNFLLLNQYRHAPRKMQYSFPRGFSEDNSTSSENAARELKEEIGATIVNEPILLGNVISDSGLTGNRVDVYLVEIESFQQNQLIHEGIKQIIEIPVNKMDDWIRQGKIDDGFSLSAYALYQSHIK